MKARPTLLAAESVSGHPAHDPCRRAPCPGEFPTRPSMSGPRYIKFDTLSLHAGQQPDPATGARATPIYQNDVLRLPRFRPCRGAVQCRAARPRVLAHHQSPPPRCSRSGSPRSKAGSGRSPPRAGRRRCTSRSRPSSGAGEHVVASSALYGGSAQPALVHLAALRHRDDVRRSARPRRISGRHSSRDPARVQRDPRQSGSRRTRRPRRLGGRTRCGAAAARGFHVHYALPHAPVRSRRGPRLPTPRRSSSAATESPSAACSSTAAPSTGTPPAGSRP